MGKKREKEVSVKLDEKEVKKPESRSAKRRAFEALIEAYKKQNPVKYEHKKEALKAKLKNL